MEIPKSLQNIDIKVILRKQGIYTKQKAYMELKNAATPLARQMIKARHKVVATPPINPTHAQFTNDEVMSYWEKQIHIVEVLEATFDLKVQQFIGKIVDGFLNHLESEIAVNKSVAKLKDYFDDNQDDLLSQAQLDFTPLLDNVAVLAGQEAMVLTGSKKIYTAENIYQIISDNVDKFTRSMLDTDRQKLVDIISNGLTEGNSIPEIRGMIVNAFNDIEKTQAQLITRTEVLRASNQAALEAYDQSGVVEGLQWLTAGAEDECADFEGEIITPDAKFYEYDSEFQDGYPPLHPNCRCVVLPVVVDTKGFAPPENKALRSRIAELEAQFDKRTKEFKELKAQKFDDEVYIKALEKYLGYDEPTRED